MGALNYPQRLTFLDLEPLELRRLQADLILVYKIINRLICLNFADYFEYARSVSTRGHPLKLAIRTHKTNYRKFFFANRIVPIWNSLSALTVQAKNVDIFKNLLKGENLYKFLKVRL